MTKLPYAASRAGQARESEIRKTLRGVGAGAVGFMVDEDADRIIAQFRLCGREITIPINVAAYEAAWLAENRLTPRSRVSPAEHRCKARERAEAAAWAILADWIKAQAAMIAAGFLAPDTAFLPHIHLPDGRRMVDAIQSGALALPPPKTGDTE